MKKILAISLITAGFCAGASAKEPLLFLPNFEDVPAAAGCAADEGFLFSVPEGKIVETVVRCEKSMTRRAFQRFYKDSMKGLGWEIVKDESKIQEFVREGDILSIEILSAEPVEARFSMSPVDKEQE
ncbi:MAG: hypothetical protein LBH81_02645 [Rickettsiales bacterium]|jgi:hypothetical protein|nr:hypothetical protein [Rickettsiales bacterium]